MSIFATNTIKPYLILDKFLLIGIDNKNYNSESRIKQLSASYPDWSLCFSNCHVSKVPEELFDKIKKIITDSSKFQVMGD